jgi:hypothetical protein
MVKTNTEVLDHLDELKESVGSAIQTVIDYQKFGSKLTSSNSATELAKVTTVPSIRQHASNCSICTDWNGSS